MREKDVTLSYVMEMKADITKQIKMMLCYNLLQNNSLQFSIASIGRLS